MTKKHPAVPSPLINPKATKPTLTEHPSHKLLCKLWPTPNLFHQIGTLDQQSKQFKNRPVNGIADAVSQAHSLSNSGLDAYLAPAEFATPDNRQTSNVEGAFGFWVDIDCGEVKAAAGKGYTTEEVARAAVQMFCKTTGLPPPTFIVLSGSGLHVYWVADSFIPREKWQAVAAKLKDLTHALGFLADDSRTADIASVLRMPGTLNYKYYPPRPVTLVHESDKLIGASALFNTIDSAHHRLCNVATSKHHTIQALPSPSPESQGVIIAQLQTQLKCIDPDCSYDDWLHVLMAIYHETGGSQEGFELADNWSSTGKTYKGTNEIRAKWRSFKSDTTNPITIATLVKMAKGNALESYADLDAFEICETEVVEPEQDQSNPLSKYSLLDMSAEVEKQTVEQVPVMGNIALKGQSSMFYAAPNTGKTLLTLYLLVEGIKQGRIDPSKLFYLNMDDSGAGLLMKLRMAEEYRFHMLADGHREFSIPDFLGIILEMVSKDQARGVIIVLDTLKKFVDLMDKSKGSNFGKVIRRFIIKGGTLIALAHTNKNLGRDGKPKFGGTSDIVDDCDCAYTLALVSDENGKRVVEFENIKRRGDVAQTAAYSYSSGNSISYDEILSSVESVDLNALEPIKHAEAIKSDGEVIAAVISCINDDINTKMKLIDGASGRAGISKKSALQAIEKYTGDDPVLHRWNYAVRERGAKVFVLLKN
jgi:hypothetical protein